LEICYLCPLCPRAFDQAKNVHVAIQTSGSKKIPVRGKGKRVHLRISR